MPPTSRSASWTRRIWRGLNFCKLKTKDRRKRRRELLEVEFFRYRLEDHHHRLLPGAAEAQAARHPLPTVIQRLWVARFIVGDPEKHLLFVAIPRELHVRSGSAGDGD